MTCRTYLWLLVFSAVLIWSAIKPHDYLTWFLEVSPAVAGLIVMALTRKKFPLTTLTCLLILVHAVVLMVGGHYTYAKVPLFDVLSDIAGWDRNHYDKLGHFLQGFVPAIIAREILIRNRVINGDKWLNFVIVSICMAISAVYELIEWGVATAGGISAEDFLGTQGYLWDTQSDMGFALIGAVFALVILSRIHDNQLLRYLHKVG